MSYKRNTLHLYDSADPALDFSVSNSGGVVTLTVDASEYLTVAGKAVFVGTTTCVTRAASDGSLSDHSLESLFDTLDTGVAANGTAIAAEAARATAAEGALGTTITSEVAALQATEATNHGTAMTAITAETTRAQLAEAALQTNVTAEQTRAEAAEAAITAALGALTALEASDYAAATAALGVETARATAAEAVIQADVDANEAAAAAALSAAQSTLQTNIDTNSTALATETARATAAEAGLQGQVSNIVSNVDPAALDSLTEIVAHFNAADSQASNLLGLLITRVTAIQSVVDTLLDPDLPALDALLTAAAA